MAQPAQASFSGYYAVSNWTQAATPDGSITTSGAPAQITLIGSDNAIGSASTDFTISAEPGSSVISFQWSYSTQDNSPEYDPFGYLLNGNFIQLTDNNGATSQSGTAVFSASQGDIFGFSQFSTDSLFGRAQTTVSAFTVTTGPSQVPGPLPILGAAAAFGYSRRLRSRMRARRASRTTASSGPSTKA